MGKVCGGPRSLALSVVLCFALAGRFGGVAAGVVIPFPDPPVLAVSVDVSPQVLPKSDPGAAALQAKVVVKSQGLRRPLIPRELSLELDRDVSVDTRGLPACRHSQLLSLDTDAARKRCGDAMVGEGRALVSLFIDGDVRKQLVLESRLLIFNGRARAGETKLFLHAHITVPVPKAIIIPVGIKRIPYGRYGSIATATIPEIAGGDGSISMLRMTIHRRYAYENSKLSVVSARCRTGRLRTRVSARDRGEAVVWELLQECTARMGGPAAPVKTLGLSTW